MNLHAQAAPDVSLTAFHKRGEGTLWANGDFIDDVAVVSLKSTAVLSFSSHNHIRDRRDLMQG